VLSSKARLPDIRDNDWPFGFCEPGLDSQRMAFATDGFFFLLFLFFDKV
jgi:hypothetical protein